MIWKPVSSMLLALAVLSIVIAVGGSDVLAQARRGTPVPPSLAKARLAAATAAAKVWKPDAVLIQIAGRGVGADGMRVVWDYGYWSAAARTCLVVNITPNNPPFNQESGGANCQSPELKEPFIDSDRAMAIARMSGITAPTATMVASVPSTRPLWVVMDGSGTAAGNVMLDIDAVTGAVVNKTSQR